MMARTLPAVVLLGKLYLLASASGAGDTIGPAPGYNVLTAVDQIREIGDRVLKSLEFVSHAQRLLLLYGVVKYILL